MAIMHMVVGDNCGTAHPRLQLQACSTRGLREMQLAHCVAVVDVDR